MARGDRVLAAVSGGADSVALLHLLLRASGELGFEVAAAHCDHALRPESDRDARFVEELCASLGVPLQRERVDVGGWAAEKSVGLEEAGRYLRYAFLQRSAGELNCRSIATGHHRQDQAETVLHRIVRGCGLKGLVAMRPRRDLVIRPLLSFSRDELRLYLADRGIAFREDPSNADRAFTRNRLRHDILPALRQMNPRLDDALSRLADTAAAEEDFWLGHIEGLRERLYDDGCWPVAELVTLHAAERRRLLMALLQEQGGGEVEAEHVLALEQLLLSARPQARLDLPGCKAYRRYDRFFITTTVPAGNAPWQQEIHGPGRFLLPLGGTLVVDEGEREAVETLWRVEFSRQDLGYPLQIRTFLPGDRIGLEGGGGHKKVKKLYAEARLPHEVRGALPLVARGGEVLWVPGLRRSGKYQPVDGADRVLRFWLEKPESIESLLVKSGCLC